MSSLPALRNSFSKELKMMESMLKTTSIVLNSYCRKNMIIMLRLAMLQKFNQRGPCIISRSIEANANSI